MEIPGKGGSIKKINEKYIYSLLSGKSFKDENFPVASFMINRKLKEFIRHFYFFARTSDDIADHEKLRPKEKLKILSYFDKCLKEKKELKAIKYTLETINIQFLEILLKEKNILIWIMLRINI